MSITTSSTTKKSQQIVQKTHEKRNKIIIENLQYAVYCI